jgi:two-component system LytT family response regulator
MTALIIDDELHCSESLELMLERYCPNTKIIGVTNDPLKGLGMITALKPDVVFLDIEMPHLSGFDLISKLDTIDFEIVFTTAYNEFAIQAFKVNAVDYLLKPISKNELIEATKKVKKRISKHSESFNLHALINGLGIQKPLSGKIALSSMKGLDFVEINSIIRCEADSNYSDVILEGNKKITVSKTLKELEELLVSQPFMRVHNSHLVNLNKISSYQRGTGGYLVMDNGDQIQVSRSKKAEFLDNLNQ